MHVVEGEGGRSPGAPAVQLPHDRRILDVQLLGGVDLHDLSGVDSALQIVTEPGGLQRRDCARQVEQVAERQVR